MAIILLIVSLFSKKSDSLLPNIAYQGESLDIFTNDTLEYYPFYPDIVETPYENAAMSITTI